jgi:uncharacterized membrane protein YbhN (UPF0104 family)
MIEIERPRRQGRIPYRLLSLLVSGVLLAACVALMYQRIDWRDVAAVWTNLNPYLVVLAALLYWLQYPANSYRLQHVIAWSVERASFAAPSFRFLFRLTCSSAFVAVAAPIGLAGDAAKIAALRLFGGLSITESARCAVFDRVVGLQSIAIVGLLTIPLQVAAGVGWSVVALQLTFFGGIIAGVCALIVFPRLLALIPHDLGRRLTRMVAGYRTFITPRRLAIQTSISLLNNLCAWGTLYFLLRAADLDMNPWIVGGFVPFLQVVNGLPFLYMGWGGREIAMAATIGATGHLSLNETLAVSMAWGVVLIATGAVNGLFLIGDWQTTGQSQPGDREPGAPAPSTASPPGINQHRP